MAERFGIGWCTPGVCRACSSGRRRVTWRLGGAIVGWVRNLADGNVETEVEGGEGEVGSFLSAVRGRFEGHITNEAVTSLPVRSDESGFVIRH